MFPANGTFTITLKNSNGQTIAASSFGWNRQGNQLVPSSHTGIENWIAQNNALFQEIVVEIDPTMIGVEPGLNTVMLSAYMGQNILSTTGTMWTLGGCPSDPFGVPDTVFCQ